MKECDLLGTCLAESPGERGEWKVCLPGPVTA